MKLQKTTMACAILAAISSTAITAEETHQLSGNVALASDYIWRGVSQTDNGLAIQGGFDYAHNSGFYLGVWASNVDFGDGDDSNIEADLYAGFSNEFSGISYDVGVIHYDYASESKNNFEEFYFGLGYNFLSAKVSYTSDYFGGTDDALYYEVGADFELPKGFNLSLHAGHSDLDDGQEDYSDWKVGISTEFKGFGFELAYTDTDVNNGGNIYDEHGVFTVSKSF